MGGHGWHVFATKDRWRLWTEIVDRESLAPPRAFQFRECGKLAKTLNCRHKLCVANDLRPRVLCQPSRKFGKEGKELNPTDLAAAAALVPPARDKFRAGPGGRLEWCRRRDGGRGDECRRLKSPCRPSGGDICPSRPCPSPGREESAGRPPEQIDSRPKNCRTHNRDRRRSGRACAAARSRR